MRNVPTIQIAGNAVPLVSVESLTELSLKGVFVDGKAPFGVDSIGQPPNR